MILHFEHGRLGNQLFQYCGFRQYYQEHRLFFVGCENLQRSFCVDRALFISGKLIHRRVYALLSQLFFFLASVRILGIITEENRKDAYIPKERKGLFSNIYISRNIFFQHSSVVNSIKVYPSLNPSITQAACQWIKNNVNNQRYSQLVFLHVRRGDYLYWPNNTFPAVLDFAWYEKSITFIKNCKKNPIFIVMGDDSDYINYQFGTLNNFIVSNNTAELDLAIMSLCNSGILSASSFAWWGAFYSRSNQEPNSVFLAPKFWVGHRSKEWYPEGFVTDWLTYID